QFNLGLGRCLAPMNHPRMNRDQTGTVPADEVSQPTRKAERLVAADEAVIAEGEGQLRVQKRPFSKLHPERRERAPRLAEDIRIGPESDSRPGVSCALAGAQWRRRPAALILLSPDSAVAIDLDAEGARQSVDGQRTNPVKACRSAPPAIA